MITLTALQKWTMRQGKSDFRQGGFMGRYRTMDYFLIITALPRLIGKSKTIEASVVPLLLTWLRI
ncbi:hypothetical protein PspCFBP13508_15970 [Pseudomonas sp. CFBP13508]|nr:hypothetical protein PspCFBP13508_15970 [Pseudomonas sp. CFBP13508]